MKRHDLVYWTIGKGLFAGTTRFLVSLRSYGTERVPREGGAVLAMNHFSYVDPPAFGTLCPRRIVFVAKVELDRTFGFGSLMRAHGAIAIRRGESDREGLRRMRETVRNNELLGLFVEGTRQRSGVPGPVQPGAAMVAINEDALLVPVAIHGSHTWRPGNFHPVTVAFGEPLAFDGLPRGGRGYKEASVEIERKLRELWEWLVEVHALGRPREATPPR